MNGALLALGALAIVGLGFFFLNRKIDRRLETTALTEQIQKEIDEILIELNGTTERNVALVEERIRALGRLLEQADRRIQVLQREIDKQARAADVYGTVARKRQAVARETHSRRREQAPPEAGSLPAPGATHSSDGQQKSPQSSPDSQSDSPPRSAPKLKERVRALRDQGKSAEQIAAALGSTVGEVELILSLLEQ